ncbi:lipoprotein localization factor LolB [Vibrio albus]|uniref:Outer-membrane lipoprotein LolB n=1 Tax=Vibrio albus TaxID=2200953 RepID=A0A2U3BEH7_9VIBR|nr:lipoprotein insertase outer membrane protein LolB [Vibrio albus]PWI35163.1 lipoprotein localization factor LolB [Vibrio albus]
MLKPSLSQTFNQLLLLIFTTLYLAGCESVPEESQLNVQFEPHRQRLESIQNYQLRGKLGYLSPDQRQSLNFTWNRTPEASQLRLTSFLGQTVLNLTITPEGAKAVTSDGEVYRHPSPNALVYQLTGLVLPITYMQDWIKGLPTAADNFTLNDTNTVATLNKLTGLQRWEMQYLSYQTVSSAEFGAIPLPYKMQLTQSDFTLKIVISKWTLNG